MEQSFGMQLVDQKSEIEAQGFTVVSQVLGAAEQEALRSSLGTVTGAGRRGLLALPVVSRLASSARMLALVRPHLPAEPIAVRAIYFDK